MHWYEEEVQRAVARLAGSAAGGTVFYGSSSFTRWTDLAADLPDHAIVNAAFGGSTLPACAWFYERLVAPLRPARLVLYAGENDIGDGCTPTVFADRLTSLITTIDHFHRAIPVTVLMLKVAPLRRPLAMRLAAANAILAGLWSQRGGVVFVDALSPLLRADGEPDPSCFAADGLHLSREGYRRWTAALTAVPGALG